MRGFLILLLAFTWSANAFATNSVVYPGYGDKHWKAAVSSVAALPAAGNSIGDARFETTTFGLYVWNGAAWQAAGGSSYTFADSLINSAGTVTLVNDGAAPGASKYYGTDSGGTKGFFALPTGTVTGVSVVSANGLAGSSSGGTTPALTLSTTVTGVLKGNGTAISAATSGTDYAPATSGGAILKGNGAGGFSSAVSSTDYAPATSGSAILKGNGAGGFSSATSGTDYSAGTSGLATGILKSTTTTGALTIAVAADFPTLNQSTSGNAATATALAANPTDCAANNYATTIDASGNLTCAQVNATAGITGTLPIGNGGTGQTTNTAAFDALAPATPAKGTLLVYNGTHWVNLGVGTDTFVVTADSAQATGVKWAAATASGTPAPVITTKSASFTASTADDIYPIDTTSGLITVTVPDATTVGANKVWTFIHAAGNGGFLLVLSGSNTFPDGSNSRSVNGLEASVDLVLKNGSNNVYQK